MKLSNLLLLLITACATTACTRHISNTIKDTSPYTLGQKVGEVDNRQLDEISGLAPSSIYHDCFWVNNDSGDDPNIYLINLSGDLIATVTIPTINRDWESIATGNGYIYIGETGDNNAVYPDKKIFKIKEPTDINIDLRDKHITVNEVETMVFNFADGQRDCETLMLDPISNELVLVSKREECVRVYTTPFTPTGQDEIKLVDRRAVLNITQATSGDISLDGEKILIKNYTDIYFWKRDKKESVVDALSVAPTVLKYNPEPQGEAIAWSTYEDAFYTVSEKRGNQWPIIYKYNSSKK